MQYKCISKEDWDKIIERQFLSSYIFASVENEFGIDYELISTGNIHNISYNKPKPSTPLKSFFLPFKENVTRVLDEEKPRIIIGAPNCDIQGLRLLDEIYLDIEFSDDFYRKRRENTLLIAADCFDILEHCHCLTYNIKPYTDSIADLAVMYLSGTMAIRIISAKGEAFVNNIDSVISAEQSNILSEIESIHALSETLLSNLNAGLPGYKKTGDLIKESHNGVWEKYSARCVSCGACTTICPTCSCFLLIDKPGFEKVKQMDACQYPGFERVAGGEDALFELHNRFRNRYMCKYVWKPEKFNSLACTGCGRCIEACIGKIDKNELFMELSK